MAAASAPCETCRGNKTADVSQSARETSGHMGCASVETNCSRHAYRSPLDGSLGGDRRATRLEARVSAHVIQVARRLLRSVRDVRVLHNLVHRRVMSDLHGILVDFGPKKACRAVEGSSTAIVAANRVRHTTILGARLQIPWQRRACGAKACDQPGFRLVKCLAKAFDWVATDVRVPTRAISIVLGGHGCAGEGMQAEKVRTWRKVWQCCCQLALAKAKDEARCGCGLKARQTTCSSERRELPPERIILTCLHGSDLLLAARCKGFERLVCRADKRNWRKGVDRRNRRVVTLFQLFSGRFS